MLRGSLRDPDDRPQAQERVKMKISQLVEYVGKKPIPAGTKHLVMELLVSDKEGEDVDVSSI
jgi:ubiquitin-activating enzyme E1